MATSCCIFGSLSCKYEKPIVVMTTASGGSLVFLYGELVSIPLLNFDVNSSKGIICVFFFRT